MPCKVSIVPNVEKDVARINQKLTRAERTSSSKPLFILIFSRKLLSISQYLLTLDSVAESPIDSEDLRRYRIHWF